MTNDVKGIAPLKTDVLTSERDLLTLDEVWHAVLKERDHQIRKWGADKQQSLAGFLRIMENELNEAWEGWNRSVASGRHSPLAEVVQIVATGISCLQRLGIEGCPISTDDLSNFDAEAFRDAMRLSITSGSEQTPGSNAALVSE